MGGAEAHPDRAGLKPIKPILIQAVCTQITVSVCEGGGMQEHASGACPKLVNMEYVKFNMFSFNVNSTVKLNVKCHGHLTVKSRTLRGAAGGVDRCDRGGLGAARQGDCPA